MGNVKIKGVTFEGIESISIKVDAKNHCEISNCTFSHSIGNTLTILKICDKSFNQVLIRGCNFIESSLLWDNMLKLKSSFSGNICILVDSCSFIRYPDDKVRYKNTSSMVSVNADARISDCILKNTCRNHLSLSLGKCESTRNTIFNTSGFNLYKDRNLSNDWGLIYVNHIFKDNDKSIANNNHKVLIEDCLIYGSMANAEDARGIMIDDGRGDVVCKNNVVLDCQSYTLDSRDRKKFIGTSSIRNVFENNILGGRYRLAGGDSVPKKDRPVSRNNILLGVYKNVFNDNANIESSNKVIPVDYKVKDGFIYVGNSEYDSLHKFSSFEKVKKYIIKK